MNAQSSASIGTAIHLLGRENVHCIPKIVGSGRYKLDGVKEIESLKGLGSSVAREEYPKVKSIFLARKARPFVPVREVAS
jgi:hypothetical protein